MSIEGVTNTQIIQKLKGIERASGGSTDSSTASPADEVDISGDARLAQTLDRVSQAIQDTPEVREDRVAEVKQNLAEGQLDSPEVLDEVAERITNVFLGG